MGELIAGQWRRDGVEKCLEDGALRRPPSLFRHWIGLIDADKAPVFPAEAGRYHLYVSLACPWAHRTIIMRRLKGLEELVGLTVAHWLMGEDGWSFQPGPGVIPDTVNGVQWLHQLYTLSEPNCSSRVTVPVLWDKNSRQIVSNESAEILRMFNGAFNRIGAAEGDYYPAKLRSEIDAISERVYVGLNNGVYRAGFTATQAAYEAAVADVFETLDWLGQRLETRSFLVGERLTEADIRLFTTPVRYGA